MTDRQTDRQTDGRTDRRTDGRTDGRTDARGKTICLPTLSGGDIIANNIVIYIMHKKQLYLLRIPVNTGVLKS